MIPRYRAARQSPDVRQDILKFLRGGTPFDPTLQDMESISRTVGDALSIPIGNENVVVQLMAGVDENVRDWISALDRFAYILSDFPDLATALAKIQSELHGIFARFPGAGCGDREEWLLGQSYRSAFKKDGLVSLVASLSDIRARYREAAVRRLYGPEVLAAALRALER